MRPPTWHGKRLAISRTSVVLLPDPIAASKSISCTSGYAENRCTHSSNPSNSNAFFLPWTSCTTLPPIRSIEGISTATSRGFPAHRSPASDRLACCIRSEKWTQPAPRPRSPHETLPQNVGSRLLLRKRSQESEPLPRPLASIRNQSRRPFHRDPSRSTRSPPRHILPPLAPKQSRPDRCSYAPHAKTSASPNHSAWHRSPPQLPAIRIVQRSA